MSLEQDDLRAAVSAGILTEAQAASVLALSQERQGHRAATTAREEPFELFKGFNEIFIVVGLTILFSGWMGLTAIAIFDTIGAGGFAWFYGLIGMGFLALCARYFTLKRRMVAPSIALTIMFALSTSQLGASIGWELGLTYPQRVSLAFGTITGALVLWYLVFRIPFTVALIGIGVFASAGALMVLQGAQVPDFQDLLLLSNDGPFAWITLVLGLIGFAVAMSFDMSDPHRVSIRSKSGFWLHVIAAPAIVNTIALTLLETQGNYGLLGAFLLVLALIAIVIDRRSFLVAGVGYVVALSFLLFEEDSALAILLLGAGLVFLGAQWERIRGRLMRALPIFPGKTRLPPYTMERI